METKKTLKLILIIVFAAFLVALAPLFLIKNAEFAGTDDAGSEMIAEIKGEEVEPWFTPIFETAIGGEIPSEVESLIFCIQTGIGVGIIAYLMGKFVERSKWEANTVNTPMTT